MRYLDGVDISPHNKEEAKALVGKRIKYLRHADIDKSGRGYFFPRYGIVEDVTIKNILINGSWIYLKDIVEMVEDKHETNA